MLVLVVLVPVVLCTTGTSSTASSRCYWPLSLLYSLYVEEKLGTRYVEKRNIPFEVSYQESGPATPVFFVLSPGVDPLKDVEALGNKLGFSGDNRNFHNVSLGQGQEVVAEHALDVASKEGHWVVLQVGLFSFDFSSSSSSSFLFPTTFPLYPFFSEHPSGSKMAAQAWEDAGAVQWRQPWGLPCVHLSWASSWFWGPHHSPGYPGVSH